MSYCCGSYALANELTAIMRLLLEDQKDDPRQREALKITWRLHVDLEIAASCLKLLAYTKPKVM